MTLAELNRKALADYKVNKEQFNAAIHLISASLNAGESTRRVLCPACNGGGSSEKSFSILKESACIKYKCWRASCGIAGIIDSTTGSLVESPRDTVKTAPSEIPHRHFLGRLVPVGEEGLRFFSDKFGLLDEDIKEANITYAPEDARYAFQVQSPRYGHRGLSLRTFDKNSHFPKWDNYKATSAGVWLGWYIRTFASRGPVVVVEDPISSLKVSRMYPSCFLNGTSLSLDKLQEIMEVGGRHGAVFALDKDATTKAIELLRKYSFFLGGQSTCVQLEKDPKYMSNKEIREYFDPLCKPE